MLSFKKFVVFIFWLHVSSLLAFCCLSIIIVLNGGHLRDLFCFLGFLPNPKLETSVLLLWYASFPYLLYEIYNRMLLIFHGMQPYNY